MIVTYVTMLLRQSEIMISLLIGIISVLVVWIFSPIFTSNRNNSYNAKEINTSTSLISHEVVENDETVDISLVIPAYNEEKRIPIMLNSTLQYLHKWCKKIKINFEIIVVDDGSHDETIKISLETWKNFCQNNNNSYSINNFRIIKLDKNHGKGGAIKAGVLRSKGKYILMVDADGATEISDLEKLYDKVKNIEINHETYGKIGIAVGSRAHLEEKSKASRAFYRTVLMHGFHILVSILCTKTIKDTQCGFKLFTRNTARILFRELHLERWAFDVELFFVAEKYKIPMTEISVTWQEIEGSKLIQSKFDIIKTAITMARDMLCVKLAYELGIWKLYMNNTK